MEVSPMRAFALVAALVAMLGLTACSSAARAGGVDDGSAVTAPPNAQQVTLIARDSMRFEPETLTVQAGQPVHLTLVNEGHIPHDFMLREGVDKPVRILATGRSAAGTFTIDRPGTYTFICSVPGHEAAGMKGTIVAE